MRPSLAKTMPCRKKKHIVWKTERKDDDDDRDKEQRQKNQAHRINVKIQLPMKQKTTDKKYEFLASSLETRHQDMNHI